MTRHFGVRDPASPFYVEYLEKELRRIEEGCRICGRLHTSRGFEIKGDGREDAIYARLCGSCFGDVRAAIEKDHQVVTLRDQLVYYGRRFNDWANYGAIGWYYKIGISVAPRLRAAALGIDLLAVEAGGRERETEVHELFKHLRTEPPSSFPNPTEWFSPDSGLLDHIHRVVESAQVTA